MASGGPHVFKVSTLVGITVLACLAAGWASPDLWAAGRLPKKPSQGVVEPTLLHTLAQHTKPIRGVAFHPSNGTLVSAGDGGQVFVWDVRRGEMNTPVVAFPTGDHHQVMSIGFQGDLFFGALRTTWGNGFGPNQVILLRPQGQDVTQVTINSGAPRSPTCAALSRHGKYLAFGGHDRILRVYDSATVGVLAAQKPKRKQFPEVMPNAVPFSDIITAVAWHPHEFLLAVACRDGKITLHKIGQGVQFVDQMPSHQRQVQSLCFSPDGKRLLSGGEDGHVLVSLPTSGKEEKRLVVSPESVNGLAIDGQGGLVAAACEDHTVRLWSFPDWQEKATLEQHTEAVTAVAFSPDSRTLATAGKDLRVQLWQLYADAKKPRRRS